MRARLACLVVIALAVGACSRGDDPTIGTMPTTTSTSEAAPGPSTSAAGSSATTFVSGPVKSPDGAAKGLFDRWQGNDRAGASRYARQGAINELFRHPSGQGVRYDDQGCEPQGGQFLCSWTYPGGVLQMTVEDVAGGGYVVELVSYAAD